jgi:hypothetical protein
MKSKIIRGLDVSSKQIVRKLATKPKAPRKLVSRHAGVESAGTDDSDFELLHDNGVVSKPNADAHSNGYTIPGKVVTSKRLPRAPIY